MKTKNKKFLVFLLIIKGLLISGCLVLHSEPFGHLPEGESLKRVKASPHYRDGQFQNIHPTRDLTEGVTYWSAFWHSMLGKDKRSTPKDVIPTLKTNLRNLKADKNVLVWFGHSGSYLQVGGKRILIDPVLSKSASPVGFINKSYKGTDVYRPEDIPDIDVLLISHDHFDHLDYKTVKALQPRIKKVICGLGVGSHFRRWGYREDQIMEKDWDGQVTIDSTLTINVTPARHNSGRGLKIRQSLWVSFVITTPDLRIFYSGDSGYDTHFKSIGDTFGPFDLALIECGQYDLNYKYTHMQPEQTMQAALDLRTKRLMPVHWARFTESNHAWDEPIKRIILLGKKNNMPMVTPMIGQEVELNHIPLFPQWWIGVN